MQPFLKASSKAPVRMIAPGRDILENANLKKKPDHTN